MFTRSINYDRGRGHSVRELAVSTRSCLAKPNGYTRLNSSRRRPPRLTRSARSGNQTQCFCIMLAICLRDILVTRSDWFVR